MLEKTLSLCNFTERDSCHTGENSHRERFIKRGIIMKLKKVLEEKCDKKLYVIDSGSSIRDAAKKLIGMNTSYLLVIEKNVTPMKFMGILTKTDVTKSLCLNEKTIDTNIVDDFMTRSMIVASGEDDVEYVMNVMLRHHISFLPIIEGKAISGVITKADILESLNVERDIELRWLSDYTGVSNQCQVY